MFGTFLRSCLLLELLHISGRLALRPIWFNNGWDFYSQTLPWCRMSPDFTWKNSNAMRPGCLLIDVYLCVNIGQDFFLTNQISTHWSPMFSSMGFIRKLSARLTLNVNRIQFSSFYICIFVQADISSQRLLLRRHQVSFVTWKYFHAMSTRHTLTQFSLVIWTRFTEWQSSVPGISHLIASIVSVKDNVDACWEHQLVITNRMHTIIILKQI